MKSVLVLLSVMIWSVSIGQIQMNFDFDTPYGNNDVVGKYVILNGASIYYEEYGTGEPLLLIHGNGGSIQDMGNQIDYFKTKFRVIAADNRGQGKSELKTDSLTYETITRDWEQLVSHLKLDSVNIVGWSDGGIIGLLMGISRNTPIKKIVAMGANLRPDSTAVHSWAVRLVSDTQKYIQSRIEARDTTDNWFLYKQLFGLLGDQPNIPSKDLSFIKAPVLIIAGDEDIIRNEHSVEMYEHIPRAQLCILPGETHYTPASNPILFNQIVNRFLTEPFKRPDSNWEK